MPEAATSYQFGSELLVEIRREAAGKDRRRKKVNVKVAAPNLSGYEGIIWSFELEADRVGNIYGRYISEPSKIFEPPHTVSSLDELIRLISIDSCYRLFDVAKKGSYATRSERVEHFEKFSNELRKKLAEAVTSTYTE